MAYQFPQGFTRLVQQLESAAQAGKWKEAERITGSIAVLEKAEPEIRSLGTVWKNQCSLAHRERLLRSIKDILGQGREAGS